MAQVGTGFSVTFASGFLAEILSVTESNMARPSIDATHMGSAQMEYIPGALSDTGQADVEIAFDPDATPPIDAAPETITFTYPNGTTWARSGFMTNMGNQVPLEERMTATVTLKFTGPLTITPIP